MIVAGETDLAKTLDIIRSELAELRMQQESRRQIDLLNARLAAIVESSDDAIVSKSLEGIVTTWNEGARRIFGYSASEMVGQPIMKLLPKDREMEEQDILSRLQRGERVDHFQTVRVTKDGRRIDVSLTISPIRDSSGKVVGASKIARDVTQQRLNEEELKQAKEEAERANAAKDQFLAVLSHELRTPLMPVLAGLVLVERGELAPEELKAEIAGMRRHIALEVQLIDDLLDHTRISRGKIELQRENTDIHELLQAVVRMCQPEIAEKGLTVVSEFKASASFIWGDARRLHQVFWNLVKNAVKFTPAGGNVILHTFNRGPQLVIEVRDDGIGIAPEEINRIFVPFQQGGQNITRQFGGLGLGLSISKSFLELHGGTLEAMSAGLGHGATFSVALPQASVQPMPSARLRSASTGLAKPARSVLLVEDHADTRRLLARLLQMRGHRVDVAGNVAQAKALLAKNVYQVLVSDIGLPDGSGVDVMNAARAQNGIYGIAVTGFGTPDDERQSREAGFALHLAKPVDPEQLEAAIESVGGDGGVRCSGR